jgi:hypothetical protein
MSDIKILEFPTVVGALTGNEFFPVIQGGVNKKAAINQVPFPTSPTFQQNAQTGNYTLVLADSSKSIYHDVAAPVATYTIPDNGSVGYALGTQVTFINMSTNAVTIAITTDTLYLAGTGTTGSRTLAQYGIATATKMTSTTWIISGSGLT